MLRSWLKSPESREKLRLFVKNRLQFHRGNLRPAALEKGDWMNSSEQIDEWTQDFCLFLLEYLREPPADNLELQRQLREGNHRNVLVLVWGKFIWSLAEQDRDRRNNPRGYLYRRFRDFLSRDDRFTLLAQKGGQTFFGRRDGQSADSMATSRMTAETWHDWPELPEPPTVREDGLLSVTSSWLEQTVEHFLEIARMQYPGNHLYPLSELIRYIATLHPWLNRPLVVHDQDIDRTPSSTETTRPELLYEIFRQKETILPLAKQLVAGWDWRMCCVYYWRIGADQKTLKAIAGSLGLADHNQAYAIYRRAVDNLSRFCSMWPGPPLTELEPGVAESFLDKTVEVAKKRCAGPYQAYERHMSRGTNDIR